MQLTLAKTEHNTDTLTCSTDQIGSFAAQIAAASRLPAIPVADWPTRAARAVLGDHPHRAVSVSIVHRSERRLERAGSAGPTRLPEVFAQRLNEEVQQRVADGVVDDRRARSIEWADQSSHPFSAASLPPGRVASAWATVSVAFVMCVCVWQSMDASEVLNLGLLDATTDFLASLARGLCTTTGTSVDWLSPRETAVLDLIVVGRTVPEIGQTMSRSANTVHDHLKSIHRKTGVHSRGELVSAALGQRPKA